MTIAVVSDVLGPENNGTTIAAMNLIRSLRAKGHTVRIVCPDEDKKGEENVYVVDKLNLGPLNGYVSKNGVTIAKPDKKLLEQAFDGVDAVHIMTPFLLCHKAVKVAKQMGLPVTAGFHCQAENFTSHIFMKNSHLANRLTYHVFYRTVFRHVDAVHYPTEFIRSVFEQHGRKTNAYVISNGVNSDFKPCPVQRPDELKDKYIILFTGRYSKEKSHRVLIDAVYKSAHAKDIQLIFAGDGPLKEKLKKQCRDLPNQPIFKFFSRREMIDTINMADLYVHPAEIEIEAISCLEAISCGLVPVISNSPRSATRFFALDEKNLFDCNDSTSLAEKIDYWLDHPEEKAERRNEYLGYTKQFDHGYCMDRMEEMILDMIAEKESVYEQESGILQRRA